MGDIFIFHFRDHLHKMVWDFKLGILISWNQSLKTRSWLKASRFMMVGKMHEDIPGRESTASAERMCLKAPAEVMAFSLPWCTSGAMGCSSVLVSQAVSFACPGPRCPAPCVTPGTLPRASWVLGSSQWPPSTTWLRLPSYYRLINWEGL